MAIANQYLEFSQILTSKRSESIHSKDQKKSNLRPNVRKDLETFSKQLKRHRKEKRYTQSKLAELISVSEDMIKRYESEIYEGINITTVSDIADALNIPIWMLFWDPDQQHDPIQALSAIYLISRDALEHQHQIKE